MAAPVKLAPAARAPTIATSPETLTAAPTSFRSRIGYLPEEPPLYKEMTVTEYLRFLGGLRGMSSSAISARLPDVVRVCQLSGREHQVIAELTETVVMRTAATVIDQRGEQDRVELVIGTVQ